MITLVCEAIPAFANRSADSAITQLRHVFIAISRCSRRRNLIGVNANIPLNCEISAANAVFFLTNRRNWPRPLPTLCVTDLLLSSPLLADRRLFKDARRSTGGLMDSIRDCSAFRRRSVRCSPRCCRRPRCSSSGCNNRAGTHQMYPRTIAYLMRRTPEQIY